MALPMIPVHPGWEEDRRKVNTHCSYCALQCALRCVVQPSTNRVLKVWGRRDFPTTRGLSCVKGQTAHLQLDHPERLRVPLLRDAGGGFREASWEEALDFAAERIREIQATFGREAVAVFGGGALTNEVAYLLGKFARLALRTPHVDYNGRYCMSSAAVALNACLGVDRGLPFPLSDILESRTVLLVGANVAECLPPILTFLKRARRNGAKLVVADPRPTATAREADLHLPLRSGTDLALALALLAEVRALNAVDHGWLARRATGLEEVLNSVEDWDAVRAEGITGVPAAAIRQAARWLVEGKPSLILTGRGPEQQVKGVDTVQAFLNLALCLGQVGVRGGGFGTLTGQGNGQGAREHGLKADQLPGYRSLADPAHRRLVAERWGVPEAELPPPGLSAQEILKACGEGRVQGLLVVGSNPAVSAPHGSAVGKALSRLKFLAVSDLFLSETAQAAHVVFPAAAYAEEDGTLTNLEGRVVVRRAVVRPPGEAKSDREILAALARRLGAGRFFAHANAEEVFQELARVSAGGRADYAGLGYSKLERRRGVFWPCPTEDHDGTPRLFSDGFPTPDGRARLRAVFWRACAEEPDGEFPLRLTTGRVLEHYLSGNQTRRLMPLRQAVPEPFVEASPELATRWGAPEGARVRLRTRRGEAVFPLRIVPGMEPSTLFVPFHWGGEGSVNRLTQEALDPASRMPELKVCAASAVREDASC